MNAAIITQYGPPNVLHMADVPMPNPMPHEVLIRVHAAGVNPIDWKLRGGDLSFIPTKFPKILGSECAGVVERVGELVMHVKPGDRVVAMLGKKNGGYADYVKTDDKHVVLLPDGVSFTDGAAVPIAGLTALQALRDLGRSRPKDHVLINGASGGVGTMGVQIARILGSRVTGVCSGPNIDLVRSLGAETVVDYTTTDFKILPGLYDVIFDTVGNLNFTACKPLLTRIGTFVSPVPSAELMAQAALTKFRNQRARVVMAKERADDLRWLLDNMAKGDLRVHIDQTYSLAEVSKAHEYGQTNRVRGKLVLLMA